MMEKRIPQLGEIKIVECNFSQYSSRYDQFRQGEILPAFDPNKSGGALMDLNIYNIHYVTGLFGSPEKVAYYPNIEKGIDTSGILIMDYKNFKCVCIGAKDCNAPIAINIQGDKGCINQKSPANVCFGFSQYMNDGSEEKVDLNQDQHRMVNEFNEFAKLIQQSDYDTCNKILDHSLEVSQIQTTARKESGIIFAID